jgi:hypothetical protein
MGRGDGGIEIEGVAMNISQIYIFILIVGFAVIAVLVLFGSKGKTQNRLTPLASLAFLSTLAGLFFGDNPFVGFGLIGVGVILAVVDMFIKLKTR